MSSRLDQLRELAGLLRRDVEHAAPFGPLKEDAVEQRKCRVQVDADRFAAGDHVFGVRRGLRVGRSQAHVGDSRRREQDQGELLRERTLGQFRSGRLFLIQHCVADRLGQTPIGHHRRAQLIVVRDESLHLEPHELGRKPVRPFGENGRVLLGVNACERQTADLGQQSGREAVRTGGCPCVRAEDLGGDRIGQRMRPKPLIVEAAALAAAIPGEHRKTQSHGAHGPRAQTGDAFGDVRYSTRGRRVACVGQSQCAAGECGIGLDHSGDVAGRCLVVAGQAQDLQPDTRRGGKRSCRFQLLKPLGLHHVGAVSGTSHPVPSRIVQDADCTPGHELIIQVPLHGNAVPAGRSGCAGTGKRLFLNTAILPSLTTAPSGSCAAWNSARTSRKTRIQ